MRLPASSALWLCLAGLAFQPCAGADPSVAPADPFAGTWRGEVIAPNDRAEIAFTFASTPRGLMASFAMPAMFINGMPLGPAHIVDGTYTLPDLNIRLTLADGELTGTFANPLLRVVLRPDGPIAPPPPAPAWPEAPAAVWTHDLAAETWASPVSRDGMIYVGCVDGRFHAVRASDGTDLWTWSGPHALYGATLVTDESVCFVDAQCDLVCLARTDGQLRWRTALHDEKIAGHPAPGNETFNRRTATPIADGNILYVGSTDHGLYALEATTGKIIWRHDIGAQIYAAVARVGEKLVVGAFDGSVVVLDRRTQAELLRTKIGGPIASAPVVANDIVVVGCRDYLLYGLKLADLSIAWRDSFWFSWVESTPQLIDGTIYVGGSDYRRISALDPADGHSRWVTEVGGIAWGTPVVTSRRVFTGTSAQVPAAINHQGGITVLNRQNGAVEWRLMTPLPPKAGRAGYLGSLALADGKIIGVGFDGKLVAFPATDP